jgi:hypothetical protein
MKKHRAIYIVSALVFIGLLLYSQTTFAAYITYEDTYSGSGNYFNNTFELQKFDSSLGTLQSVVFTWDGILDGSLGVEANASSVWYTMNTFTANVNLNKPGSGGGVWSHSTLTPPSQTVYTSHTWNDIDAVVINEGIIFTDGSDLSWFTGSGNFELSLLGWFGLSKNQEGYWAENPLIWLDGGKVTVKYEYDGGAPVPEPSTFLLFGAGLLGLTGVIRRRIKK